MRTELSDTLTCRQPTFGVFLHYSPGLLPSRARRSSNAIKGRRSDMKTDQHVWPSGKELEVLKIMEAEPRGAYGLDIVSKSEGRVGRTTIYILLGRLEEKGFVRVKKTEDFHPGRPRRIYVITAEGARALAGVLVAREIRTTRPRAIDAA
jgi:DNA-binding PadR family transcriptional regulator